MCPLMPLQMMSTICGETLAAQTFAEEKIKISRSVHVFIPLESHVCRQIKLKTSENTTPLYKIQKIHLYELPCCA